jgi:hypothetical protein
MGNTSNQTAQINLKVEAKLLKLTTCYMVPLRELYYYVTSKITFYSHKVSKYSILILFMTLWASGLLSRKVYPFTLMKNN